MKNWKKLTPREMWDFIDSAYLKHELKTEELMQRLGLKHEDYLKLRKNNSPVPDEVAENFFKNFKIEKDDMPT